MRRHMQAWLNALLVLGCTLALFMGAANHVGELPMYDDHGHVVGQP